MFIINCKNYEEASGENVVRLVKIAQKIAKKYKVKIAVAPPTHLLAKISNSAIPILAQHVDDSKLGSTTGFIVPEQLKRSNIAGALINHSEHRIPERKIVSLVSRLKELDMISVVCVKDVSEAKRYSKLNPDYIAIEPPELIGSGKAVSQERPELVTDAAKSIRSSNTKLLCGAGIVSGRDVKKAKELGSSGILVASGIIKAKDWSKIIEEFAVAVR